MSSDMIMGVMQAANASKAMRAQTRLAQLAVDGPSKAAKAGSWARRRGAGLIEVGPDEQEEVGEE